MMFKKIFFLLLSLVFWFWGLPAWADDDAIIDIDNHVATFTGTWGTNNTPILFYGDDFRWAACSGDDTIGGTITAEATFSSNSAVGNVDITGEYAVYVRWVAHPNRTDSARYRIFNGITQVGSCIKDQRNRGGEWVYCDTVNLTAGNTAVVKLGNNCETGKYVIADAVRFVRVSKDKDDIIDEPGADWTSGGQTISLTDADTVVRSVTINAPTSGYVIVNASGFFSTTNSCGQCSITTGTTWDSTHNISGGPLTTGSITQTNFPFAGTRGFNVSVGSTTFNLVCKRCTGASVSVNDTSLTAIFVPSRY